MGVESSRFRGSRVAHTTPDGSAGNSISAHETPK